MIKKILFTFLFSLFFVNSVNAATYQLTDISPFDVEQCTYLANVYVDTEGAESNAADLILKYSPNEVEILDADDIRKGIQIIPGSAYESYVFNKADDSTGVIKLTAVRFDAFVGRELFVQIPFIAKVSNPQFQIVFEGIGNTFDSNIAELDSSLDLLNGVSTSNFNLENSNCDLANIDRTKVISNILSRETTEEEPSSILIYFAIGVICGLLSLLILITLILKVRIRVLDEQGKPVKACLVIFYSDGEIEGSYITNRNGTVWILRQELKRKVEFKQSGFKTKSLDLLKDTRVIKLEKAS
jgi:hypothetical protein